MNDKKIQMPNGRKMEHILRYGTPEQIATIEAQAAEYRRQNPSVKIVHKEKEAKEKKSELQKSMDYIKRNTEPKSDKPKEITFDSVKGIFWEFHKQVVFRETGLELKISEMEGKTIEFSKNFIKWLIGDSTGLFDPKKSLYMWGALGVGKSTLAEVGYMFMSYLKYRTNWTSRHYEFISMDELFLEMYTTASLDKIGKLAKGFWCLDELREKHLSYKHYGNNFNILADILAARHNLWKHTGTNTIITANIPPDKLDAVFDDARLMDRIKQQYVTYELIGSNKRNIIKTIDHP